MLKNCLVGFLAIILPLLLIPWIGKFLQWWKVMYEAYVKYVMAL